MRVRTEDGGVIELPDRGRRRRKGKKSKAQKARERLSEAAKRKALVRLRDRHLMEYLELLADERRKLGWAALPEELLIHYPEAVQTMAARATYHAPTEQEVADAAEDVDAQREAGQQAP